MSLPDGWTVTGVLQVGTLVAVIYFVLNVFFESNVRHFLEQHGWDQFLSRALQKMRPLTERRGFWFAFGLTLGVAAWVWADPQVPLLSSISTKQVSKPEYLKNITFGVDDGGGPTWMRAESVVTTDKLRVLVDYSLYRNGWVQKIRAPIGEIKNPVNGERVEIIFTSSGRYINSGTNDLWWGLPPAQYPIPAPDLNDLIPALPVRARLVIIGPSNDEQHYYFMLIRAAAQSGSKRFGILRGPEADWIAEWEGETHK